MKKLPILLTLLLCFSISQAFAQFEGTVQFDTYKYASGKKKKDDDSVVVYFTPDRIALQGDKNYKVGGALETDGILVRMKEKDFVFMTGKKQAMKISKAGITSFMNMFGDDMQDHSGQAESNISFKKTGKSQKVNGYSCEKFIFTDKEEPNKRAEVCMTKALDINWGMLAEPWSSDKLEGFTGSDIPLDLVFEQGYFPLRWKEFEGNKLKSMTEAKVNESAVDREKVEVPAGVKVVSLQNYLFQQMRQQQ